MKNNIQFLKILVLLILPCLTACSDDSNKTGPEELGLLTGKYSFPVPEFEDSFVYVVSDGERKVAEICNEYISGFSMEKRATVAYPFNDNGEVEHTKGFVIDNGGSVSWTNEGCTYTAGTQTPAADLYLNAGTVSFTAVAEAKALTVVADVVKDVDNNVYKVVKIGTQYWLGENFKSTKYNDGSAIRTGIPLDEWEEQTDGLYTAYQAKNPHSTAQDAATAKANYGLLYNWYAAHEKLAPTGWKLPSNDDWSQLRSALGDNVMTVHQEAMAGAYLCEVDFNRWAKPPCAVPTFVANDITGFTAVGAGGNTNFVLGECTNLRDYTYWWAAEEDPDSEEFGETYAFYWMLNSMDAMLKGGKGFAYIDEETQEPYFSNWTVPATYGHSVRFVRR